MRVRLLLLVVSLAVVAGWPCTSRAEKVRSNQTAKLLARPGEHAPMIIKIKSGQVMTVLAKEGRWIKVRVSGRTGYVPRSKVDLPESDDDVQRNTRRRPFVDGRGTKRGFGGESGPDDRVGADATGDGAKDKGDDDDSADDDDKTEKPKPRAHKPKPKADDDDDSAVKDDDDSDKSDKDSDKGEKEQSDERPRAHVSAKTTIYNDPDKKSGEAFTANKKTVLIVSEKKGKWTFVETDEGDAGYVLTSKLDIDESGDEGGPRRRMIALRGRLGVTLIKEALRTPGGTTTVPDNYNVGSSAATVAVGATVLYPYEKNYVIGGELAYDYDHAFSGIAYNGKTTAFTLHNFNLRAVGGYDLHKSNGMMVFARLGFHYTSFQVANVANLMENTVKLPSEIIKAPTIGAAVSIPRLTDKIGLRFSLDAMLVGVSMTQTKNLEDGTDPSAKGVCVGAGFSYRWKPQMDIQATYDLNYQSISFGGMAPATSMRGHTGTGAPSRTDLLHTVSVGVGYAF